jgi:8-oxo-dGTP pyrophosphatase MutT (NUDIX family)
VASSVAAEESLTPCQGRAARTGSVRAVEVDRPGPGEDLNTSGETTVPRQAASVIVLRGGDATLELLLVQRTPKARFMGGVWVFPGGAVDAHEGEGDLSHRRAAVRELEEEAGIGGIDPTALVKFSRWITPRQVAIRFDTHFFLAPVPLDVDVVIDGEEIVDVGWFTPGAALEAYSRDELALVFPTIKHLEQFAPFASADALLQYASGREVLPIEPRVIVEGEVARVLLPGEPGYDDGPELTV